MCSLFCDGKVRSHIRHRTRLRYRANDKGYIEVARTGLNRRDPNVAGLSETALGGEALTKLALTLV